MEQVYIGNGRALDPAKYFIIVVNQIGNGLSTSPNNSGGAQAGPTSRKCALATTFAPSTSFLPRNTV